MAFQHSKFLKFQNLVMSFGGPMENNPMRHFSRKLSKRFNTELYKKKYESIMNPHTDMQVKTTSHPWPWPDPRDWYFIFVRRRWTDSENSKINIIAARNLISREFRCPSNSTSSVTWAESFCNGSLIAARFQNGKMERKFALEDEIRQTRVKGKGEEMQN